MSGTVPAERKSFHPVSRRVHGALVVGLARARPTACTAVTLPTTPVVDASAHGAYIFAATPSALCFAPVVPTNLTRATATTVGATTAAVVDHPTPTLAASRLAPYARRTKSRRLADKPGIALAAVDAGTAVVGNVTALSTSGETHRRSTESPVRVGVHLRIRKARVIPARVEVTRVEVTRVEVTRVGTTGVGTPGVATAGIATTCIHPLTGISPEDRVANVVRAHKTVSTVGSGRALHRRLHGI